MAHDFEKKWRSADVRLQENVDFSALLLSDRVLTGLTDAGFKKPSPIQLQAIPMGRFGKDLLVQAKSGTGKTLVFVIVALEMLKRKLFRPQVLVLVPTREIATQICAVMKSVGSTFSKLICNSFIGGMPLADDREKAVMSQIVVGTPGRLKQLIQMQALPINSIRLLVFDEADQLLETSFKEDIAEIFNLLPEDKQVIATSATYPPKLKQMMMKYLRDPHEACLNEKQIALLGMVHYVKVVEFCPMPILQHKSKLAALEVILKKVKFSQCLLFCNGVLKVEVLYKDIKKWGFSTAYISSAKEQTDRLKAIDRLKHFKCKVLVSSDLTARGIDAENVDLVVNFDVSSVYETYMHRVGRAGRYGSVGVAITIVDEKEIKFIQKIEEAGGFKSYKLPDPVPLDLVLHPSKGEYVIPEVIKNTSNSENGEKSYVPDDTIENGIDIDSVNNANTENVELERVSDANLGKEISVYSETGNKITVTDDTIENNVLQPVKNGLDTRDEELDFISIANGSDDINVACRPTLESISTTKSSSSAVECTSVKSDIEQDTPCAENGIASYNENYKIINYNEEKKEVAISEAHSRNKIDVFSNFLENESSNLQSDCIDTTVIDNPSPNKIDSYKNLYELCSEEFRHSPGNRNSVGGMENNAVTSELRSNIKSDDLIKSEIEISNEEADCVFEIKDAEVSVSANDSDLSCKKENNTGMAQNLNYVIRTFVDNYEENKNTGSTDSDNTNEMHADSGMKAISLEMVKEWNIRKNEFLYKLFNKYQNEQLIPCCKNNVEEKSDVLSKSVKNDNPIPVVVSEENSPDLITVENDNPIPVIVCEENSTGLTALTESSEIKVAENLPGKPSYESTPHHSEKSKLQIIKTAVSESKTKMEKQNKLLQLFQESSDESDSSDSKLSENSSSNQSSTSDESESGSDSSESESDSGSSSASSSDDETSDSVVERSRGKHLKNSRHPFQSRGESRRVACRNVDEDRYRRGYPVPYTCTSSRNQTTAREELCRNDHRDNGKYRYQRKYSAPPAHKCDSFGQRVDAPQNHQKHSKHMKPKCSSYYPNYCTRTNSHPQQLPGSQYFPQSIPQLPTLPSCMNREMHNVPDYSDVHQNHTRRGCSHRHFQAGGSCRSEHRNKDYHLKKHSQSDWKHYPDLNCYMPSDHRCHPDTSDYACSHGPVCAMWYEEFRKQWLYIQNVMNG